jgi:hypothetical protein
VTNRWIRFLLAVLAIAAAAAATYRVVENEQRLARDNATTRNAMLSADAALAAVEELKATLHAYVAPGQGADFWTARAGLLLDKARSGLLELESAAGAAGVSVAEALDACDRLASLDERARAHVAAQQPLLAGEVIFTDARDLLDAIRIQIARSRDQISSAAAQRAAATRREQTYLLGGGAGVLALVMLLLVPIGRTTTVEAPTARDDSMPAESTTAAHHPVQPIAPQFDSAALAAVCSDIAVISESSQVTTVLDRVRALLGARGVIVWMSTPDRANLQAAAASGYDERVVARLGNISRNENNLTADAFRLNGARTSASAGATPAALAVPLPAPGGPAGVFSAELAPGVDVDAARLDAARVVAAQLAAVLGTSGAAKSPDAPGGAPSAVTLQSSS